MTAQVVDALGEIHPDSHILRTALEDRDGSPGVGSIPLPYLILWRIRLHQRSGHEQQGVAPILA